MEHDTSDDIGSSSQNDRQVQTILNNPKFQELVRKKRMLSWSLAALMLFIYIGFILLVAYAPDFLHSSFNGATTWGIPLGIGVIISAFLLTAIYAVIANGKYERLTQDVVNELESSNPKTSSSRNSNISASQGVNQP
ncbi:MAG: DUF485 domain-containing protein [Moraxellaceae bacterium]|nr:MAG: DUF485 domain-containing protein [Moraxellaceae bacterium]